MSIISEPINVGDFLKQVSEEAKKLQSDVKVECKEKYDIKSRFKRYKDDPKWLVDFSRESCELATVKKRKEMMDLREKDKKIRGADHLKYAFSDAPWKHAMVKKEEMLAKKRNAKVLREEITEPEVIITLHYHKPITGRQKLSVYREIQVLGNTLLTQLRDYFPCVSDDVLLDPVHSLEEERCDEEEEEKTTKSKYKSGFLFIENVFYNDFRDPQNIDYSRVVLEWAEAKRSGKASDKKAEKITESPLMKSVDMDGVRIKDLTIRQNKPYLYCHQGDCEHIIIFTDMRLLNGLTDTTDRTKYPLETLKRGERKPLCSACHVGAIRWVVANGKFCPEDPCFFCNSCMCMFNCTPEGKLIDPNAVVHSYPRLDK